MWLLGRVWLKKTRGLFLVFTFAQVALLCLLNFAQHIYAAYISCQPLGVPLLPRQAAASFHSCHSWRILASAKLLSTFYIPTDVLSHSLQRHISASVMVCCGSFLFLERPVVYLFSIFSLESPLLRIYVPIKCWFMSSSEVESAF